MAEGETQMTMFTPKRQRDANTEFEEPRYTEWGWFIVPLLAFMLIDYLYLSM
jgi:hypothetical protein